jgi:hypothetical protein
MNDYLRFVICTAVGFGLGFQVFHLVRKTDSPKQRFIPSALGGAAAGALGGMMMTSTHLGDLPFANWWVPTLISAVIAISLQKTFANMLEHGRPPDV